MHLGLIIETDDAEKVWNAYRLANRAVEKGDTAEVFLTGEGVKAPDLNGEGFDPEEEMREFLNKGGDIFACGTCLDLHNLEEDKLRPRSNLDRHLRVIEESDKVVTVG